MELPDINYENFDEYIPSDGFGHWNKNIDCPCHPTFHVGGKMGAGIVHKDMSVKDTFPAAWIENIDPPLNERSDGKLGT